jgi:hypothetical protein
MARDKLITIRIEGEKREAFNQLAKAQNTDTASLLYDFISGCLDGRIDISLVTGKGNRLDKIDNQIDSERIDKLETDTQRIDNRLDTISKKLADYVEAFDDRLNDCDQGLSNKIISLEHRLNALAMQLDSQQDRQQIGSIDTDSQKDSQQENPDIEPVATVETVYTVEAAIEKVESNSSIEPDKGAIGPVPDDSPQLKNQPSEDVTIKPWYTVKELLDCHYQNWPGTRQGLQEKADREQWPKRTRRGIKGNPYEYQAVLPD